jgi:NitT/TauT family transport system substrate-binding protein
MQKILKTLSAALAGGLAVTLAMTAVDTAPARAQETLIVAEPVHSVGYLPVYVAIRKGFFKDAGVDVKVVTLQGGAAHTNAVLSKQAFAFIGGPEHNAFAKLKGAELRAVANVVNRGNVYFVARKGVKMAPGQSLADFVKGKSISVSFHGGTPNSITRYFLAQWKLAPGTDVRLNEIANGAEVAAVKAGATEIGVTTEPMLTRGVIEGIWEEPFLNVPKELGPYAYSTINIRLESIEKEPKVVAAFVKGLMQGLKFTYANHEEAVAVAKQEFPTMSSDDLMATLKRSFADEIWSKDGLVSPEAWSTGHKVVRNAGLLNQDVAYEAVTDMQFVKALATGN